MKSIRNFLSAVVLVLCVAAACTSQDDIYEQYVVPGGKVYPAKAKDITSETGFYKLTLFWPKPKDPSIVSAKVYWDNYTDSLSLEYSNYADTVTLIIDNLADRTYTFNIVNYDKNGNQSLAAEYSASPYGNNWLSTHSERTLSSVVMSGNDAVITLSDSTAEMVATKFLYKTVDDEWIEYSGRISGRVNKITLPNAKKGTYVRYASGFLPENGRDTAWMSWTKCPYAIVYTLDTEGWEAKSTTGMDLNSTTTADKIFDGVTNNQNNRWHSKNQGYSAVVNSSYYQLNTPVILSVDTHSAEGNEPCIRTFRFYRHPTSSGYRYLAKTQCFVGDKPYDPDLGTEYLASYGSPIVDTQLYRGAAAEDRNCSYKEGRYFAIVFLGSYSRYCYLDVWELEILGYYPAEAEAEDANLNI